MNVCQREGCDTALTPTQRKWCSENCRKRACDDAHRATCIECGAVKSSRSGFARARWLDERCDPCERERKRAQKRDRVERVAEMYNAGLSYAAIAAALGYGPNSLPPEVTEARRLGLIGYRNRGYGQVAA